MKLTKTTIIFAAMTCAVIPAQAVLVSYGFSSAAVPTAPTGAGVLAEGSAGDVWMIDGDATNTATIVLNDVSTAATLYTFQHTALEIHSAINSGDGGGIGPFINSWYDGTFPATADPINTFTFSGFTVGDEVDLAFFANFHFPTGGATGFNRGASFTIGGDTTGGIGTETNSGQASAPAAYDLGVNYVQFDNLIVGASGDIVVTVTNPDTFYDLNGFQLQVVPVPEPSSSALLGLGGLALILRRRK